METIFDVFKRLAKKAKEEAVKAEKAKEEKTGSC